MLYNYPSRATVENPPPLQLLPDPVHLPSAGGDGSARGAAPTAPQHPMACPSPTASPQHWLLLRTPSAAPRAPQPGKYGPALQQGKAGSCNGVTRARMGSRRGFKHTVPPPQSPPLPRTAQRRPRQSCCSLACPEKQTPPRRSRQPAWRVGFWAASRQISKRVLLLPGSAFACEGWLLFASLNIQCCEGVFDSSTRAGAVLRTALPLCRDWGKG